MSATRRLETPGVTRPAADATFDFQSWRLEPRQVAAAAAVLAYVTALWLRDSPGDRTLAALAAIETVLLCLPWRVPRSRRSATSFWAESLVTLIAPFGAVIVAITSGVSWLRVSGAWWWYLVGALLGLALLLVSGVRPGAVLSGEIAFAMGPSRRSHAHARAFVTLAAPPGEEALFRGPALVSPHVASFGLLASVAFVARHHVQPGGNGRGTTRQTLTEVIAAASLLLIVVCSHSVYPALLAHLVNNLPGFVVEFQREGAESP